MSLRKTWLIVFLLCLLSRLLVVFTIPEIRVSSDSLEYLALAQSLSEDFSFSRFGFAETYRTPVYPFFLYCLNDFFGVGTPRGVAAVQALLFAVEAVMVFHAAFLLFGKRAAWFSALILLLNPASLLRVASVLTEGVFSFMLALLVWLWVYQPFRRKSAHYCAIGLVTGLLCLTRPVAQWLFVILLPFVFLSDGNPKQAGKYVLFFLLGVGLTQGAWIARNYYHYSMVYVSETSATNLYVHWAQAVHSLRTGEGFDRLYENAWDEWDRDQPVTPPPEMKQRYTELAMDEIAPNWYYLFPVAFKGVVRQVAEPGSMKLLEQYQLNIPLSLQEIKTAVLAPDSVSMFGLGLLSLVIRVVETVFLILLYCLCGIGVYQSLKDHSVAGNGRMTSVLLVTVVLYFASLSSGPYANLRFREQYFSLVVLLAVFPLNNLFSKSVWKKGWEQSVRQGQ